MQQALQRWRARRHYTRDSGFTIVELIIVIIVIAILALIVITTHNGVQTKAKNTKTIAAVEAWTKAITLYHADTGSWPINSCLGDSSTYDGGTCWNGSPWFVQANFLTEVQPYMGGSSLPQPDTTGIDPSVSPKRGAFYYNHPTLGPMIWFMQANTSSCPKIGGLTFFTRLTYSNGIACETLLAP